MSGYREGDTGLPPLFSLRDFAGSFGDYIDALWYQYRAMTREAGITLWGRPLVPSGSGATVDGRDACFWHLLTDSFVPEGEPRRFSLRRAEALPRTWAILELLARGDKRVWWWRDPDDGTVIAAAADWTHKVVLRARRRTVVLTTAFPVKEPGALERQARVAWFTACARHADSAELFDKAERVIAPCKPARVPPLAPLPAALSRAAGWM